jgi:hypothetical protein
MVPANPQKSAASIFERIRLGRPYQEKVAK